VVGRLHHRELKTSRVLEVQVQLTVLGLVSGREAWADVGLESVESKGKDLAKVRRARIGTPKRCLQFGPGKYPWLRSLGGIRFRKRRR
jgi:hypothetical protein